jgi:cation diffusion facilitator CzcD-associated flavoprotein CzcO
MSLAQVREVAGPRAARGAGSGIIRQPRIAVIGAGFSGLGLGIRLKRAGLTNFTIFEKADNVGGTWRDNRYPGLSCDIPSRYYAWTFAPNPNWSMTFSPGAEIQAYIEKVAKKERMDDHIRFGTPITAAHWDQTQWHVWSGDKDLGRFDFVISAVGFLHYPNYPDIKGLETFKGKVVHTAEWDDSADWVGKKVGVIGNGSTGTQVVASITPQVSELVHFMRTPQWMVPMDKKPYRTAWKLAQRFVPGIAKRTFKYYEQAQDAFGECFTEPGPGQDAFVQMPRDFLEAAVPDPELRAKLTPDYPPGCRRLIVSSEYYQMIQQPNAHLVREGIVEVVPEGVITADGTLHELDLLIIATGYDANAFIRRLGLVGRDGVTVEELWKDGYRTYESVALENYPNFFMLGGPHSPFGHFSFVLSGEHQSRYAVRWIEAWARGEYENVAPTSAAVDRFTAAQRTKIKETTWGADCVSWYQDVSGTPSLYPWSARTFRESMSKRVVSDFDLRR